jgi:hypothetical protein
MIILNYIKEVEKMNEIYIKTDYHNIFEKVFTDKDLVSIDDLVDMLDELYYENESLREQIEDLEKTHEPDYYDEWHDQQLEKGVI